MKRTNRTRRFLWQNRRLLLLIACLLIGCFCGLIAYRSLQGEWRQRVLTLLPVRQVGDGFLTAVWQVIHSCFHTFVLLLLLFFSGLSACGIPFAVTIPWFWGVGLGMTLAHYYTAGGMGVLFAGVMVLPHSLPEAAALLIGCAQTLHMSMQICGQLLPHGAHCGGLWQDFRLYGVRFLLLLPLLLGAGVLDVGLRLLLLKFFPAPLWV